MLTAQVIPTSDPLFRFAVFIGDRHIESYVNRLAAEACAEMINTASEEFLPYRSYKFLREAHPGITVAEWKRHFAPLLVDRHEARYISELNSLLMLSGGHA
jgi:hypothetical protein